MRALLIGLLFLSAGLASAGDTRQVGVAGGELVSIPFDKGLPAAVATDFLTVTNATVLITVGQDNALEIRWQFSVKPKSKQFRVESIHDVTGAAPRELELEAFRKGRIQHFISMPEQDVVAFLEDAATELYVFRIEGSSKKTGTLALHQAIQVDRITKSAILREMREKGYLEG